MLPHNNPPHSDEGALQPAYSARRIDGCRRTFVEHLKSIPIFSGDAFNKMVEFIQIADVLQQDVQNDAERREFATAIALKLRGRARVVMHEDIDDWEGLKRTLRHHFGYLQNRNGAMSELENIRQKPDETLADYSKRARKLFDEMAETYDSTSPEVRDMQDHIARQAFIQGIHNQRLTERVTTRGAKLFQEALTGALQIENSMWKQTPNSEFYCNTWKKNGHRERDCRTKAQTTGEMGALISALRAITGNNSNAGGNRQSNNNNNSNGNRQNNSNSQGSYFGNWNRNNNNNSGYNRNNYQNNNQNDNNNNRNHYQNNNQNGNNNGGNYRNNNGGGNNSNNNGQNRRSNIGRNSNQNSNLNQNSNQSRNWNGNGQQQQQPWFNNQQPQHPNGNGGGNFFVNPELLQQLYEQDARFPNPEDQQPFFNYVATTARNNFRSTNPEN